MALSIGGGCQLLQPPPYIYFISRLGSPLEETDGNSATVGGEPDENINISDVSKYLFILNSFRFSREFYKPILVEIFNA